MRQDPKSAIRSASFFFPLVVLFCSLIVTFFAWRASVRSIHELAENKFEKEVGETILLFEDRLELYFNILYSVRALFAVRKTETVDRDEWTAFNETDSTISRFPGIAAVRFIQRVKAKEKAVFIESVREDTDLLPEGYPDFKIFPEGERDEYYVVKYFEPFEINRDRHGFDVLTEPVRREAFLRARDTGEITATERLTLQSDEQLGIKSPSFLLILPIYRFGSSLHSQMDRRTALYGFVDVACRMNDFLASAFDNRTLPADLAFEVFDSDDTDHSSLLYSSHENVKVAGDPLRFSTVRKINVGGRVWVLRFQTNSYFRLGLIQQRFPLFVAAAGTAISTLLFGVLLSFSTSRARALKLAEQMTKDLRREVEIRKRIESDLLRALKVKSEFLSMVSHELRTPLTVIKESVGIVGDGSAGTINTEQKDFLSTAVENTSRLTRLINDVLDFQRFDSGRFNFKMHPVNLNELVLETAADFQIIAGQKKLRLVTELPETLPAVRADRDKIVQVLTNLIGNAIKFSRKGTVKVTVSAEGEEVKVSVSDQGIGIREEDFAKLFQSFSQIENESERQAGGTGLGLAISKKIIEGHGGRIGVDSRYGEGSVFYFFLGLNQEGGGT